MKLTMEEDKIVKLKEQLLKERQELEEEIAHMSHNQLDGSMSETTGELSTYDNHPADMGSEMFERSKDLSLREGMKHQVSHIDDALKSMSQGTYGVCEMCGKKIDDDRLEAMPSTTLCLACKENTEKAIDRQPRPIEEEVIQPPFGHLGRKAENNMYDGEDAWQDVARYGTSETPQDIPNANDYQQMTADADEDRGHVQDVDGIPYFRGADGMLYEDFYGFDDEDGPREVIRGDEDWDRITPKS